jgi:5,10-methylenetetrahydrofolate reductase
VLCLTGDRVEAGDHPGAKPVFDLDSLTLIDTVRQMRDRGRYISGRVIAAPPRMLIGAAENPFAPPVDWRPLRLKQKIDAGAQFIQTQFCYEVPMLEAFMARARDMGLDRRAGIIVGVGPLASAKTARWLRGNVAGVHVPDAVIKRLEQAKDQAAEGRKICVELMQEIRRVPGVAGVHLMAFRQEQFTAEIIRASGIVDERRPAPAAAAPGA